MNFELLKKIHDMSQEQLANLALLLAIRYPETFSRLANGDKTEYRIYRGNGEYLATAVLDDDEVAQIRAAAVRYSGYPKIGAIKKAREITDLGLLEAKLLVEAQGWF